MECDLLALVGDGVDAGLVDTFCEEVAFGVIASEEAVQVVVDFALQRACTCGSRSLSRNCDTSALLACMMR